MARLTDAQIAETAHEANAGLCRAFGDHSQPAWADAPEWQRESAINGVAFHRENPDADPADSHANWLREKIVAGWIWGEVKDPEAKEHPCMLPYDELPPQERAKDHVFRAVCHALLKVQ